MRLPSQLGVGAVLLGIVVLFVALSGAGLADDVRLQALAFYGTAGSGAAALLWHRGRRAAAFLVAALGLYVYVGTLVAVSRPQIFARSVPEIADVGEVDLRFIHFTGLSILFGALTYLFATLARPRTWASSVRPHVPRRRSGRASDWHWSWLTLPTFAVMLCGYVGLSLLTRWRDASYINNDVVKGNRVDALVLGILPATVVALLVLALAAPRRSVRARRRTGILLALTAVALVATAARIGARAQLLYGLVGCVPALMSYVRQRSLGRTRRMLFVLLVGVAALLGLAALRTLRSPLRTDQGPLDAALAQLTSIDSLLDQDYVFPPLVLLNEFQRPVLDAGDVLWAEIGAAVPFAPAENTSLLFASKSSAQRALLNEGFGASPLLLGLELDRGAGGILINALALAGLCSVLETFQRRFGARSEQTYALGMCFSCAIVVSRSEWLAAVFYLAVFAVPVGILLRQSLAQAEPPIGGVQADARTTSAT